MYLMAMMTRFHRHAAVFFFLIYPLLNVKVDYRLQMAVQKMSIALAKHVFQNFAKSN